jgi:hypothetical protein
VDEGLAAKRDEVDTVRRALLLLPVIVAALLAVPDARSAEPTEGTIDQANPVVEWSGSVPVQTAGFSGVGCQPSLPDPTCDLFTLTVGELKKQANDVVIGIASAAPSGTIAEFDLYVYDETGAEVGRGTELGSNDTVTLRDVAAGAYTVGVQSPLSTDPTARYDARATAVDAGDEVPVDEETPCGLEGAPEARDADAQLLGAGALTGDPTAALDGATRGGRIELGVHVVLDEVTEAEAHDIFRVAAESYRPLGIDLVIKGFSTHEFGTNDGMAIIREAKTLFGGAAPKADGVDVVEALVGYDIQQLGQTAVAGIADCIGGVAHADRSFLVAEGKAATDIAIGPGVFQYEANPHITAHEIGHLMGGQHHYANCVEGIQLSDVHEDHVEGSPCTLMFNAADFLGWNFDTLNGVIVRGSAERYADQTASE